MYLFLAVFLSMMIYFVYFQVCKSESFINSPYNSLQAAKYLPQQKYPQTEHRPEAIRRDACLPMQLVMR